MTGTTSAMTAHGRRAVATARRRRLIARRIVASALSVLLLAGGIAAGWWAHGVASGASATPTPTPTPTPTLGSPSPSVTPTPTPTCTPMELPLVLLTGSSTMERWTTSVADLAPLRTENIGVSGTKVADQLTYLRRIIPTLEPDVLVVYSGANDLAMGRAPADVVGDLQRFVAEAQAALPGVRVYVVSVNPAPAGGLDAVLTADAALSKGAADGSYEYIETAPLFRAPDGSVDTTLFADGIHPNKAGYALFGAAIRDRLLTDGLASTGCR